MSVVINIPTVNAGSITINSTKVVGGIIGAVLYVASDLTIGEDAQFAYDSASRVLAVGPGTNVGTAQTGFALGSSNNHSGSGICMTLGTLNNVSGATYSLALGTSNDLGNANRSIMAGNGNSGALHSSLMCGTANAAGSPLSCIIGGNSNSIASPTSALLGGDAGTYGSTASYSIAWGYGIYGIGSYNFAIGYYTNCATYDRIAYLNMSDNNHGVQPRGYNSIMGACTTLDFFRGTSVPDRGANKLLDWIDTTTTDAAVTRIYSHIVSIYQSIFFHCVINARASDYTTFSVELKVHVGCDAIGNLLLVGATTSYTSSNNGNLTVSAYNVDATTFYIDITGDPNFPVRWLGYVEKIINLDS